MISIQNAEVRTGLGTEILSPLPVHTNKLCLHVRTLTSDQAECLVAEGHFTERENLQGYPDSFAPEKAVSFTLSASPSAPALAITQHKAWWTRPVFGEDLSFLPEKTQLLLRRLRGADLKAESGDPSEDSYELFLAICSPQIRADLSSRDGNLICSLTPLMGNLRAFESPCLVRGQGKDPYALISSCFRLAMRALGREASFPEEKTLPSLFRGLGWCTWDSLGWNVSEKAIFAKMEELQEKKVPLSYVLIDDGWSEVSLSDAHLKSLDADPVRFPNGLSGTIKVLKEKYHVRYVGVWQASKGYWCGVEEGSQAGTMLAPFLMRYPSGELSLLATPDNSFGLWNRWHSALKEMGVDFVKVDGQGSFVTMLKGSQDASFSMRGFYQGLEASVFLNFGGAMIHCMCLAPENLWNRSGIPLARSSDDYTPAVPGSLKEHVLQNAYNNFYQGSLSIGDWDMFWTDHEEGLYGTLLRVISGGPVYVSDALERTKRELLDPLMDEEGKLLLCDSIALPAKDCLTRDVFGEGGILKLANFCAGSVYLCCLTWEREGEVSERVYLKDLPWMKAEKAGRDNPGRSREDEKASYLVLDVLNGSLSRFQDAFEITMGSKEARLLAILPEKDPVTVLGLLDKYIGLAPLEVTSLPGLTLVDVRSSGTLGFVTKREITGIKLLPSGKEPIDLSLKEMEKDALSDEIWRIHLPERGKVLISHKDTRTR